MLVCVRKHNFILTLTITHFRSPSLWMCMCVCNVQKYYGYHFEKCNVCTSGRECVCVCMSVAINCFRCNFCALTGDRARNKNDREQVCGQQAYYGIISSGIFFNHVLISCLDDSSIVVDVIVYGVGWLHLILSLNVLILLSI